MKRLRRLGRFPCSMLAIVDCGVCIHGLATKDGVCTIAGFMAVATAAPIVFGF